MASKFPNYFVCSIDATEETPNLGRLVNHGAKRQRNSLMKVIEDNGPHLCLFASKEIEIGEQITYDYGVDVPWEKQVKSII